MDVTTVIPGAHGHEQHGSGLVFGFQGLPHRHGRVNVLGVIEAVHQQGRHHERLGRQHAIHGLVLPELVIGRVLEDLPPEAQLLHATLTGQFAGGTRPQEGVVVVEVVGPPALLVGAGGLLLVDVGEVLGPEGTVVEPVVPAPAIHHGVHGHSHLQGRMGIHQAHEGQETVVGDAQDAHAAIALRQVLHQPVDGVVGIRAVIDSAGIPGPLQGPRHHVITLGAILPADVLHHADVATLEDEVRDVVGALEHRPQV